MTARTILLYLFGHAGAIRAVAESRASFVTGLVLVLITTIPRNYDQTFIGESPLRWLFGSLAFSLVSGTWLYGVAYGWLARWRVEADEVQHQSFGTGYFSAWRGFMGLFWMTAPIAWLYALPVERFLDSITATKVNIGLLATVSIWRVLLMARVFQVLCGVNFLIALAWVLLPAGIETFGATVFNGHFGKRLMAAMGGMRNSPEEDLIIHALGVAADAAMWVTPIALVLVFMLKPASVTPLPAPQPGRVPTGLLAALAVGWLAIAIVPQVELARTARVSRLIEQRKYREALDYLAVRKQSDFAPAVPLPPKTFEWTTFKQLPGCIGALNADYPTWLRAVMLKKLDEMVSHSGRSYGLRQTPSEREAYIRWIEHGSWAYSAKPQDLVAMLTGLSGLAEGRAWLNRNELYLLGLKAAATSERNDRDPAWQALAAKVEALRSEAK